MTIGFKVQVVIRQYKDSPTVRCHSIHKVVMREYQFAELVSHIRLTASKIKIKKKNENIIRKIEMTYQVYMIIATLAAENSTKQTKQVKKPEH